MSRNYALCVKFGIWLRSNLSPKYYMSQVLGCLLDLKYLFFMLRILAAQTLTNAKTRKPASALTAAVRTPGEAMIAHAVETSCISGTMILA